MTKRVRFAAPACSICAFVFASFDYRCVTCVTTVTPVLRSKTRAQQLKEIEKDIDTIQVRFVDLQKSAFVFVGITVNLWCLSPLPTCLLHPNPNPRSLHFFDAVVLPSKLILVISQPAAIRLRDKTKTRDADKMAE